MQKVDYGDINKFLVSMGLILISLSLISPYFYLKEEFGIFIEPSTIDKLKEPIKKILLEKQKFIIYIQTLIPWISIILFILGSMSAIIGLKRWFVRQQKIDWKYDLDIRKLEIEIDSLTPTEQIEKAQKEIEEIEFDHFVETGEKTSEGTDIEESKNSVINYLRIERDVVDIFRNYKSPNFDILDNQRLGERYKLDLLLKARTEDFSDRIVEIRYFSHYLRYSRIQKALFQLNSYISYYKEAVSQKVIPVLLMVYEKEKITSNKLEEIKDRIDSEKKDMPNFNRLKVAFIEKNDIANFEVKDILKR